MIHMSDHIRGINMFLDEFVKDKNMSFDQPVVGATKEFFAQNKPNFGTRFDEPQISKLKGKMRKLGWVCKSTEGAYSAVFINDSKPYILKINVRPDSAFAWFAFLTKKFPNPHFPNIGNAKTITLDGNKYYLYM